MKRVLSWVVLVVCTAIVYLVQTIAYNIAMHLIEWFLTSSVLMKIALLVLGGGTILTLAYVPIVHGAALSIVASDMVWPSISDLRYIIWGTIYMLFCLASFVLSLLIGSLNIAAIAGALYGLALIVMGNKHRQTMM